MYETLLRHLESWKRGKITLTQLEELADPGMTYSSFQPVVRQLIDNHILIPVISHGLNGKNPPLPLSYRIRKSVVAQPRKREIQSTQLRFHPDIKLDGYYSLSSSKWNEDLPFLEKINCYLTNNGVPREEATAPERSFQLVGDEKWIDEKGGRKLLEMIGIWELLRITPLPDPLMLAVNPGNFRENKSVHRHLIVENKTTFYAIQPVLPALTYTALIYGAGWKAVSGLGNLQGQLGLPDEAENRYMYFGDLDHEGISIWHAMYERYQAVPAVELYQGLLRQTPSAGKESQMVRDVAIQRFLAFFPEEDGKQISHLLQQGKYLPQEALEAESLRQLMKTCYGCGTQREE